MKRADKRNFSLNGITYETEFIGQGRFSKAYRIVPDGDVLLFTDPADQMKEMVCHLRDAGYANIPHTVYLGEYGGKNVYQMPYYRTITKDDTEAWEIYQELKEIRNIGWDYAAEQGKKLGYRYPDCMFMLNDFVIDHAEVDEKILESLHALNTWMANYGSTVVFEFAAHNIGVDKNGEIIFRDCAYDILEIIKKNN